MGTRKSPEQSATLYKEGTVKTGNDGNKWVVAVTSTNVKRWVLKKRTQSQGRVSRGRASRKSAKPLKQPSRNGKSQFLIKLKLFYVNTIKNEQIESLPDVTEHELAIMKKEPNPSNSELTKYLLSKNRYQIYIKFLLSPYIKGVVSNVKINGLTIEYVFTTSANTSEKEIKDYLFNESLEDSTFEGYPGSEGVYPTALRDDIEHGVIDYRKQGNISVTLLN